MVSPVLRSAGTTSSLLRYAKEICFQFTGLLEPPAPSGCMSELLAPKEVTFIENVGWFITTSEHLSAVIFSASLVSQVRQNCWLPAMRNQLTNGDCT
jgi:hypothetical protein